MNLLCLGPKDVIPPDDGGKEGIHGALAALAKKAAVTYAYPAGTGAHAPPTGYSAIGVQAVPVGYSPRESAALMTSATLRLQPYKFAKHSSRAAVEAFVGALRAVRFDAIVCFHPHVARLAERILQRRRERAPLLLREHNLEYALVESYARCLPRPMRWAATAYARITRREEQRIWRRADAVALLSDGDLRAARASGVRANFVLAPEGVPLPPLREAAWPGPRAPLLILFNPSVPQNVANLRMFFENYWVPVQSARRLPGLALAVTGLQADPLARLLARSAAELDALNVRALGFVERLPELFAASLALVSPTFVGAGVRKKVLEAMAHQLPVIATALDVESCSFYEPPANLLRMGGVDDLVAHVRRLADDRAFWSSLSRAGRETVERHAHWDRFADVILAQAQHLSSAVRRRGLALCTAAER